MSRSLQKCGFQVLRVNFQGTLITFQKILRIVIYQEIYGGLIPVPESLETKASLPQRYQSHLLEIALWSP